MQDALIDRRHAAFMAQEEAERRFVQWQNTGQGDGRAIADAVLKARSEFMRVFAQKNSVDFIARQIPQSCTICDN